MTLMHTFSCPCDLAQRLPTLLAAFMELEISLTRRFREDTLSDLFTAAFLQLPGLPVAVLTPDETRTGSDVDLELVDPMTNTTICYRIQAKRLGRPTVNWKNRSYHHLAHPNDSGGQVDKLCHHDNLEGPIPTIPIYAFFNNESVCSASGLPGIALADAFEIKEIIENALAVQPRPLFKRISSLHHLFFGLDTILCPPNPATGQGVATPKESRDAFEATIRSQGRTALARLRSVPEPASAQFDQLNALRARARQPVRTATTSRPRIIIATSELDPAH